jgi:hypothetical protein
MGYFPDSLPALLPTENIIPYIQIGCPQTKDTLKSAIYTALWARFEPKSDE